MLPKAFLVCQYRPSSFWASFESKDYFEQILIVDDLTMKIFSTLRLETSEVIPSISPFPPPPRQDHIKETRDSWDQRHLGISEHLAPMQGHRPQITARMTHWWWGDFQYSSCIWCKAVFERRAPLTITSKVHINFLLTLAQSQAFSQSKLVLFINPNQMNSFLDFSFWQLPSFTKW